MSIRARSQFIPLGVREEFAPQHTQGDSGDTAGTAEHPLVWGNIAPKLHLQGAFPIVRKHNFILF